MDARELDGDALGLPADAGLRRVLEDTRARLNARPRPPFTPLRSCRELSFELFPPSSERQAEGFVSCLEALAPLAPSFVSVTYGAGGTTRLRTLDAVRRAMRAAPVAVAAHLTTVAATREETDAVIDAYAIAGVRRIVALRGDPPARPQASVPPGAGYADAAELVAAIHRRGDFDVSVAAYPEVHPKAASAAADLDVLKRKVDAGASRAITQFFFEPECYLRFVERARRAGITVPIVPGILPVHDFAQLRRFAERCGASVPAWMADLYEPLADLPEVRLMVSATVAAELCMRLADQGVDRFHFYTMNRAPLTRAVCHLLGCRTGGADAGTGPVLQAAGG